VGDADTADAFVHAIARDWRTASLSRADRALCGFAAKLTHEQKTISPADLDTLREQGFDDRGISDAVQIIAYFNYITRIADGLGVDAENFILPWGSE
jgi:uncharacterized peroxidase-related enzyme